VVSGSRDGTIRVWDARATESDVPHSAIYDPSIGGAITLECFRTSISKSQYSITGRGWISSPLASVGPKLILWVPPPNQNGISGMETISIFGTRTTCLDLRRFVHGEDWMQYYDPTSIISTSPSPYIYLCSLALMALTVAYLWS
jgi:WD40 repeat protein